VAQPRQTARAKRVRRSLSAAKAKTDATRQKEEALQQSGAAIAIVAFLLALFGANPCPAQERDRSAEVATYDAIIEELMSQPNAAIWTRVDQWQEQLDADVEARVKGLPYPKNIIERVKGYNDSPVTEAVYSLLRKATRQEDAALAAHLARAFTGFGGFTADEAMRHIAAQLELGPASRRQAFRERLCRVGREDAELRAAAFELANFERYLGSAPARPGTFTMNFLDTDRSGREKRSGRPRLACD
jgi:hypothetical protein